jgi:hypothetical protein
VGDFWRPSLRLIKDLIKYKPYPSWAEHEHKPLRSPIDVRGESGTFRTLVLLDEIERWSLITLRERVVKIGAKVISHARYTVFQMAEVAIPRDLFRRILDLIDASDHTGRYDRQSGPAQAGN